MLELHSKKKLIQSEIEDIKIKINEKNKEIEALKTDFTYIEKIAREKLKMSKPGEKVFKVEWDYLKTSLATLKDFKSGKWYLIRSEIKLEIIFLL